MSSVSIDFKQYVAYHKYFKYRYKPLQVPVWAEDYTIPIDDMKIIVIL